MGRAAFPLLHDWLLLALVVGDLQGLIQYLLPAIPKAYRPLLVSG